MMIVKHLVKSAEDDTRCWQCRGVECFFSDTYDDKVPFHCMKVIFAPVSLQFFSTFKILIDNFCASQFRLSRNEQF